MKRAFCFWVLALNGWGLFPSIVLADDPSALEENPNSPVEQSKIENSHQSSPNQRPRKTKVRASRDKETEGTQAPNRFETDLIIKSKYKLNGQDLEVDTD